MLPAGNVIVGKQKHIGIAQKLRVLGFPLLGAADTAGGSDIPTPKQIGLGLALNNEDRVAGGDCFEHFRQTIRHRGDAVSVVDPLAAVIRIWALLSESLVALAVLKNEVAAGFLKLAAFYHQNSVAVLVVILKFGDDNFMPAKILAIGLWLRPSQRGARGVEVDAI
jgi:hypothetical protein